MPRLQIAAPARLLGRLDLRFRHGAAVRSRRGLPGDPPDKVLHIVAFLVLTVLAIGAYPRTPRIAQSLGLFGFGALIELLQMVPMLNREAQLMDWVAAARR